MEYPRKERQRILVSVDWFPPAFRAGGPIRSVFNLVSLLSKSYDVWVVTGAYDLGEETALDVPVNTWNTIEFGENTIQVIHWTRVHWNSKSWNRLVKELKPDWLYLNSVFSKHFTLLPLQSARRVRTIRVVLAPRGMLGAAALGLKPLKKRIFLAFARATGMFRDIRWHVSTSRERDEVLGQFMGAQCHVAQNIPMIPVLAGEPRDSEYWELVSVGRIHRVKNLHFGLEALLNTPSLRPVKITFIGPIEDVVYHQELLAMAQNQDRIAVEFTGGMAHTELTAFWNKAHYFISSTTQENFGHAIVEAWAHGCPVLISDQTPWRALESKGIGWDLPLNKRAWLEGLKTALEASHSDWKRQSQNAKNYFDSEVHTPEVEQDSINLFQ